MKSEKYVDVLIKMKSLKFLEVSQYQVVIFYVVPAFQNSFRKETSKFLRQLEEIHGEKFLIPFIGAFDPWYEVINRRIIQGIRGVATPYNTPPFSLLCSLDNRTRDPLTSFIDFTSICREHPCGVSVMHLPYAIRAVRDGLENGRHTLWKGNRIEMTPHGSRIRDTWPGDKARFSANPPGS